MSASQIVGGIAGIIVGYVTQNPQLGFMTYAAVSGVGAYLEQPDRMGPRLEDLRVQMSQYGATVPFEWGTNRHAGTIIWPRVLEVVEHREEESSKGGPENVTFKYTLSCAVLLCEGPIAGVRRIWANKKIIYDVSESNTGPTQDPRVGSIRLHLGTEDQMMDPLIEATDGEGPAYRGYAYVVFEDYDVTDLNGRPPQWEFEVITEGNTDIEPTTTFGEAYSLTGGMETFSADMDSNGHIWLHTMGGHAWLNPDTGTLEANAPGPGIPQVHEYDAATGKLLWYYDVPVITEQWDPDTAPFEIYPIQGTGVCSGGFYFIGRGAPGWPATNIDASNYVHGLAVNMQTHAVESIFNTCSSKQFQNASYWPSVPVPVVNNNKVFFCSSNGFGDGFGVGFMPASIAGTDTTGDIDPIPDFSGETPTFNVPVGWAQARAKAPCPVRIPPAPPPTFDGTGISLPGYARKSTVIRDPDAVIIQGVGAGGGSYVALATAARVTGFDLSAPNVPYCELPSSSTVMPPVAWDAERDIIWAFGTGGVLYSITQGGSFSGLAAATAGFILPAVSGEFESTTAQGMSVDATTGLLRVIRGAGSDGHILLIDPIAGAIVSDTPINVGIETTTGKVFDMPGQNKVVFANGFKLYSIPYGANLAPNGIPLSQIVRDISIRAGLSDNDIDVSDLADSVDGYIVPRQMTARAAIEPLQQAFFFDAVESDDKIKFVKRGADVATAIPQEDRAAHEHGQNVPDALTVTRAFEYELPVQCDIEYPDIEADHLIGNQYDRRITKDTRHNLNLQLPIVMTSEKAKSVARTLLYDAWQNQAFKFSTSRKYAHLEPTSLVELPTASAMYRGRITGKREQPNGIINWEAKVDSVTVYSQTGEGAAPTNYVPQTIFQPSSTYLEMLDIPLLRDEDENAGFYVAMGGV